MIKKRILILSAIGLTDENAKNTFSRAIQDVVGSRLDITIGNLTHLTFELSHDGSRIYDRGKNYSLDDFDFVVFRDIAKKYALASSCAIFLQSKNIKYIDSQIKPYSWSKYAAQALRQSAGIPNIASVTSRINELIFMIENNLIPFGYPLIIKDNNGKKGNNNFLARDKAEAINILNTNKDIDFIIQEYIENDGDYRFLVMGEKIRAVIKRKAQSGSHLNNTSQGAVASLESEADFSNQVVQDVISAAKLENREVAGVDLVIDRKSGEHYIIEVNASPQIATGAFKELKVGSYIDYLEELIS